MVYSKYSDLLKVSQAFRPEGPLTDRDLFAMRSAQVSLCVRAVSRVGSHIALYGERGVGKTSLIRVLPKLLLEANLTVDAVPIVNCHTGDSFRSLWRSAFRELDVRNVPELERYDFGPEDVRFYLQRYGKRALLVFDEFDRLVGEGSDNTRSLMAETMKTLSDNSVPATLMLVGIADSLDLFLGEHGSVVRSLVQVPMRRMVESECAEIIKVGCARAGLSIDDGGQRRIINLSEGLPHFVHLLALHAGERAVHYERSKITIHDVDGSLALAIDNHHYLDEYDKATSSSQPGNIFHQVLLACAYAPKDELGYFRPISVAIPLGIILDRETRSANYHKHLGALSGGRSQTLQRIGSRYGYRYRFNNPLLQTFAKIRALSSNLIDEDTRQRLEEHQGPAVATEDPDVSF